MVAYIFPGQGAQYVGMSKDFYQSFPEAKNIFDCADKTIGFSLSNICFNGPSEELTRTQNCQPAILTASIAILEVLKKKINYLPKFSAGLSLGEYSALVAAGSMNFSDALVLVKKRAELMEEEAGKNPGSMAAILGLEKEILLGICKETDTQIANFNCPGQLVISGKKSGIEKAMKLSEEKGAKRAIPLEVSGGFHSILMHDAGLRLEKELEKIKITPAKIPVVSNVDAKPTVLVQEIKNKLQRQVESSVLWEDSVNFMIKEGVNKFFEIGPGKVLKGLIKKIDPSVEVVNIEKIEDLKNI